MQRGRLDLLQSLSRHYGDAIRTIPTARLNSMSWRTGCNQLHPRPWIDEESDATRKLYGMDNPVSVRFNQSARAPMVERGVRFISSGSGSGWDAQDLDKNHGQHAGSR